MYVCVCVCVCVYVTPTDTRGESVTCKMLNRNKTVISGFRRVGDKNCILLGCYAASSGNSLPTFRNNLSVPSSKVKNPIRILRLLTLEDGADRLSRNVGMELSLLAA